MPMLPNSVITTGMLLGALKPVERWQAMRDFHEHQSFMVDRRFILAGVAVIAVLSFLLFLLNYRQRRRESKVVSRAFNSFARRNGLNAEEQSMALLLADIGGLSQPETIFVSAGTFDNGAAMLLARESGNGKSVDEQNELARKLTLLRSKLGFSAQNTASKSVLLRSTQASSRQIPVGKILQVTRRKSSASVRMEARLIKTDEIEFTAELPDVLKIEEGEVWNLQYNFGPSVWEFDARLLRADGREVIFGHSDEVRFISRRRFLRVGVVKDAYIARFPFAAGKQMNLPQFVRARLKELAGPGLLIEAQLKVNVGERVLTIVQATDDKVVQDIGEVRHIKASDNGFVIAVELIEIAEENVDELVRLTNAAAKASKTKEPVKVG
jgi:hypothetical protein